LTKQPDRFYINKADKEKYDALLKKGNIFARDKGIQNKDIFILAAILGFQSGQKEK